MRNQMTRQLLWLSLLCGMVSAFPRQDVPRRVGRGGRSYRVTCRDEKTQMVYRQHESWLRPMLRSNRVEYCWCNGGRSQCHSVPVKSCSEPRCFNGGTCLQALYFSDFVCQCPEGFVGKSCEIEASATCYKDEGASYRGTWSTVESGAECVNWNSSALALQPYNGRRPNAALLGLGNHNYCRNPDGDLKPWCYVFKMGKYTAEFCTTPACSRGKNEDCYSEKGLEYRGTHSRTKSGATCLQWNSVKLMGKIYTTRKSNAQELGLGKHNYCRNPDGDAKPWCHVQKYGKLTWEYCDVPQCCKSWLLATSLCPLSLLDHFLCHLVFPVVWFRLCSCQSSRKARLGGERGCLDSRNGGQVFFFHTHGRKRKKRTAHTHFFQQ